MTRLQYCIYILKRIAEMAFVAILTIFAVHYLQRLGWLRPANHFWAIKAARWLTSNWSGAPYFHRTPWFRQIEWWTWPALAVPVTHLLFGPKQKRPIYLKIPGAMYVYGHIKTDRNAGCRGGLILGATGSGKTVICIQPRNHSIAINECGIEKKGWAKSPACQRFEALRAQFRAQTEIAHNEIKSCIAKRRQITSETEAAQDDLFNVLFAAIHKYQAENPDKPFSAEVFTTEDGEETPDIQIGEAGFASPEEVMKLITWARTANRFGALSHLHLPAIGGDYQRKLKRFIAAVEAENKLNNRIEQLSYLIQVKRIDFQKFADGVNSLRWEVPPFGALVIGAKGNEYQTVVPMMRHYNRDESIALLQTRPVGAPENWTPPAQFNLISYTELPAMTYAQILFVTYLTISQKDEMDFFENAARDTIAYGITLLRVIRACQNKAGVPEEQRVIPNLKLLCEICSALANYKEFMKKTGAAPYEIEKTVRVQVTLADGNTVWEDKIEKRTIPEVFTSSELLAARKEIENGYWALPDETLKGVMGSIRNVLVPFTEDEVAQVFCSGNTFDLREMEGGKVVCVAMPQKYSVQRQYVATILKNLTFQIIANRFDLRKDQTAWTNRNLVLVDSDEHQISAGKEDARVDIIREASGTLYGASQMINSLWKTYGGKDKATPIIKNLRNGWFCQAASEECAEEASKLIGEHVGEEYSHSSGMHRSTSISYRERAFVSKTELKALKSFYVFYAPAESKWLYKLILPMPVTPDCQIPNWWFGSWNPLEWLAYYFGLPETCAGVRLHHGKDFIPPWKSKAPFRAHWRYLWGLDGTFITIRGLKRHVASRTARRPEDLR